MAAKGYQDAATTARTTMPSAPMKRYSTSTASPIVAHRLGRADPARPGEALQTRGCVHGHPATDRTASCTSQRGMINVYFWHHRNRNAGRGSLHVRTPPISLVAGRRDMREPTHRI